MSARAEHKAVDFPLLKGEQEEWSPGDAEHWAAVYDTLLAFCQEILSDVQSLGSIDREMLALRVAHYRRRRLFWERRKVRPSSG